MRRLKPLSAAQVRALGRIADGRPGVPGAPPTLDVLKARGLVVRQGLAWCLTREGRDFVARHFAPAEAAR